MRLNKKISIVTGCGNGLGKAIALEFGKQGSTVICANRTMETGEKTAEEIKRAGGDAVAICCDISDAKQVENLFGKAKELYGKLDVIVNNAGITGRSFGDGPTHECKEQAWDMIMAINMRGTFLSCKHALKLMLETKTKGSVINMSSVLGLVGCQDFFTSHAYQTTKAGIIGLTRSIAAYYAKFGIRANTLAPGFFKSRATENVSKDEKTMNFINQMQPLGALGDPDDVAMAAVYLACSDSKFITGQVLTLDGGWTMQ